MHDHIYNDVQDRVVEILDDIFLDFYNNMVNLHMHNRRKWWNHPDLEKAGFYQVMMSLTGPDGFYGSSLVFLDGSSISWEIQPRQDLALSMDRILQDMPGRWGGWK